MSSKEKQLSVEELETLLKKKKAEERRAKVRKRDAYLKRRDELVCNLAGLAKELHQAMQEFKLSAVRELQEFQQEAAEYGDITKRSKGGFSLRDNDAKYRVSYDRNTKQEYDERADTAETLLKQFLEDKIKKRDQQSYRMVSALLEKNEAGDYKPGQVASLLAIKDNYDDKRWVRAMELFEESYRRVEVSNSVSFYEKDENGKDRLISLTFPSL